MVSTVLSDLKIELLRTPVHLLLEAIKMLSTLCLSFLQIRYMNCKTSSQNNSINTRHLQEEYPRGNSKHCSSADKLTPAQVGQTPSWRSVPQPPFAV